MKLGVRNIEATQFGRQHVSPQQKTDKVSGVFSRVARRYDLMNDVMSLGWHRVWKDLFVTLLAPWPGENILDLAGGTGDMTRRILAGTRGQAQVTVCDYSAEMMAEGQRRMVDAGRVKQVSWVQGDAADLPFDDNRFDAVTISFGLRNVTRIDDALSEIYRTLKPGGRFFCMEFSPSVSPLLRPVYETYRDQVIPRLGQWVAGDKAAYQYLAESIARFPTPENLLARMENVGFTHARAQALAGGIVYIHRGWKIT